MKIIIDTKKRTVITKEKIGNRTTVPLYSKEGFEAISNIWLKQEWNQHHWKSFSWLGLPVKQFPEDLVRLQEVIWQIKPDVIVETGVSLGGSSMFFASICKLMGKGRVISIDINIPEAVRKTIEQSWVRDFISLIEGDSSSPPLVEKVKKQVGRNDKVLVFLDSDHSKAHVLAELEAYSPLVSTDSYIVATDGVMQNLVDTPNGKEEWTEDNPAAAAREFAARNPDFIISCPEALYGNEFVVKKLTFWPDAWLRRISGN